MMTRLVLLAGLALFAAQPAFAHALLRHATPGVGSTVRAAPTAVTLTFSEGVEPKFSAVEVDDAAGKRVDANDLHTVGDNKKDVAVTLGPLADGTYTVIWHMTSVDTHKTEGKFTFSVAK